MMHLHLFLLLLVPVLEMRQLRMVVDEVEEELTNSMEEYEVANTIDTEAEEESNEEVNELELEAANSDEEEADEEASLKKKKKMVVIDDGDDDDDV